MVRYLVALGQEAPPAQLKYQAPQPGPGHQDLHWFLLSHLLLPRLLRRRLCLPSPLPLPLLLDLEGLKDGAVAGLALDSTLGGPVAVELADGASALVEVLRLGDAGPLLGDGARARAGARGRVRDAEGVQAVTDDGAGELRVALDGVVDAVQRLQVVERRRG